MFGLSPIQVAAALCVFVFATGQVQSLRADTALVEGATAAIMASDSELLSSMMADPASRIAERLEGEYAFLHLAAMVGDTAIVEALLEAGAEIDAIAGVNGWTPLMHATHQGREAAVRLLLERGANQNVTGTDLSTAAILARYSGLMALFDARDTRTTATATHHWQRLDELLLRAVEAGDREVIETLIVQGADPNAISSDGWTPLLYASARHDTELFQYLSKAGAAVRRTQYVSIVEAAVLGAVASKRTLESVRLFIKDASKIDVAHALSSDRELAVQFELDMTIVQWFDEPLRLAPKPAFLLSHHLGPSDWARIQQILRDYYLYEAEIDGVPGPRTRRGIYAYYRQFFEDALTKAEDFCLFALKAYQRMPMEYVKGRHDFFSSMYGERGWEAGIYSDILSSEQIFFRFESTRDGLSLTKAWSYDRREVRPDDRHGFECLFSEGAIEKVAVDFPKSYRLNGDRESASYSFARFGLDIFVISREGWFGSPIQIDQTIMRHGTDGRFFEWGRF